MITAVVVALVLVAVLTLWRTIILLKAARKALADAREQSEVTLALTNSAQGAGEWIDYYRDNGSAP